VHISISSLGGSDPKVFVAYGWLKSFGWGAYPCFPLFSLRMTKQMLGYKLTSRVVHNNFFKKTLEKFLTFEGVFKRRKREGKREKKKGQHFCQTSKILTWQTVPRQNCPAFFFFFFFFSLLLKNKKIQKFHFW
jgi:hypothetical protein